MGVLSRTTRRAPPLAKAAIGLGAAWWAAIWGLDRAFGLFLRLIGRSGLGGSAQWPILDALRCGFGVVHAETLLFVFGATIAVALGLLGRTVARARARAHLPDPLDGARAFVASHPRVTRGLVAVPAILWVALATLGIGRELYEWGGPSMYGDLSGSAWVRLLHAVYGEWIAGVWIATTAASLGVRALTRAGLRALLAPTIDPGEGAVRCADDRIAFDAIAVTAETRAAIAAMAVLPVLTVVGVGAAHLGSSGTEAVLAAYVAVALAGTLAFRRLSRVAVGVDGVFVTGTSRTRFFAYKHLTEVRAEGTDLVLLRDATVALRLQLHGEDATHRDAIALRIGAAIDTARRGETAAAGQVVASVARGDLARIVDGASDYRAPALTREQLWSLVEGPEHDAATRTSAARALSDTGDPEQRARLRVAAERCAEPQVRIALMELVDVDEEEPAGGGLARWARS